MSLKLREKLLALLRGPGEEKPSRVKAPAPVIIVREESPAKKKETVTQDNAPIGNGAPTCPKCGILLVEVSSGILRCQACGFQAKAPAKRAAVPPIIGKRTTSPAQCPQCASTLLQAVGDGGGGWRCGACGCHSIERHATGLSRAALGTYDGLPAHAQ